MNNTQARTELQSILADMIEYEENTKIGKRRVWEWSKKIRIPDQIVIRDEVECERLRQEVQRLERECVALKTDFSKLALKHEALKREAKENFAAGILRVLLENVYKFEATNTEIIESLDEWVGSGKHLDFSPKEMRQISSQVYEKIDREVMARVIMALYADANSHPDKTVYVPWPTDPAERAAVERLILNKIDEKPRYAEGQNVAVRLSQVGSWHNMIDAVVVNQSGNEVTIQDADGTRTIVSADNVWPTKEAADRALNIHVEVDAREGVWSLWHQVFSPLILLFSSVFCKSAQLIFTRNVVLRGS
jgi:hypothetical protein